MQISVQIWALCDKVLRDDPNESSAVYLLTTDNKHAVCRTDFLPMQINFFAKKILATILLCGGDFRSCARQVKRSSFTDVNFGTTTQNKFVQILFFNNPNYFFFVIPKVCWTVCVFHFLNLESLKKIYTSLLTFRDLRHRRTMVFKVEQTFKHARTTERNSTMCECIFHQLAVKNVNVNVVKTIYCQRNLIFLRPKKFIVFIIWPARIGVCLIHTSLSCILSSAVPLRSGLFACVF